MGNYLNQSRESPPAIELPTTHGVAENQDVAWLAGGSLTTLTGSLVGRGLQLASQVVLARVLGPAAFGLYAIGWALLRVSAIITPLGLDNGAIHFATRYIGRDVQRLGRVLGESLSLAILFGTVVGLATCVAAPTLARRVFGTPELLPVIYLFATCFPLAAGLRVASASTTVSHSMKYSVRAELLTQPAANLVLICGFYFLGWRLAGAVAATVISFGVGLILAVFYQKRLFPEAPFSLPRLSSPVTPELLRFSLVAWLGVVFVNLIPWVDRLFVGAYLPPAAVGIYQAAAQASLLLGIVAGGFNSVVAPRISFLFQTAQMDRLRQLYKVVAKWMFYVSIPPFLVFCFTAQKLLAVMYGTRYIGGSQPFLILSVMWLTEALIGPVGILLTFTGRQGVFSVLSAAGLALSAILNYLLIPRLGILGAALATSSADIAMLFALLLVARASSGFWPFDRRWLKGMISAIVAAGFLLFWRPMNVRPVLLGLLLTLGLSTIVFVSGLMILGLDEEDHELVRILKLRLTLPASGG